MVKQNVPRKLWDHCLEYQAKIRCHTASDSFELQGQTPESAITGQPSGISHLVEVGFYDFVMFWDTHASYPKPKETMGRWLGPADDIGSALTSKIIKENGQVIPLSTFRNLSEEETIRPAIIQQMKNFDEASPLHQEIASSWWVPTILRKRDRIIKKVKTRYQKITHKFGFELPNTVKRALEIDRKCSNTLWQDAIGLEMDAVRVAFNILDEGSKPPPGYSFMEGYLLFDIKMEDFRRKVRYVAGGHRLRTP